MSTGAKVNRGRTHGAYELVDRNQQLPTLADVRAERARRHLIDFTEFTFPGYAANWHHRLLARALDRLVARETKRLMVFMAPQHGKSELVSRRLPAYALGRRPDDK